MDKGFDAEYVIDVIRRSTIYLIMSCSIFCSVGIWGGFRASSHVFDKVDTQIAVVASALDRMDRLEQKLNEYKPVDEAVRGVMHDRANIHSLVDATIGDNDKAEVVLFDDGSVMVRGLR